MSRNGNDIFSSPQKFWDFSSESKRSWIIFKALCRCPVEERLKIGLVYSKLSAEQLEERDPKIWRVVAAFINKLKV